MAKKDFNLSRKVIGIEAWKVLGLLFIALLFATNFQPLERIRGAFSINQVAGDVSGTSTYATVQTPAGSCSIPTATSGGQITFVTPATASLGCRSTGNFVTDPTDFRLDKDELFSQVWTGGNAYCNANTNDCSISVSVDIDETLLQNNQWTAFYKICKLDGTSCGAEQKLTSKSSRTDVSVTKISNGQVAFIGVVTPKVFTNGAKGVVVKNNFEVWQLVLYNFFDGTGTVRVGQAGSCATGLIDKSRVASGVPETLGRDNTLAFNYVVQWIPFAPLDSSKNPLVDYNGQKALCLAKSIWSLSTFKGADGSCYAYPNKMAGSPVECCPQDETPSFVCNNFKWQQKTVTELKCTSDAECHPSWVGDYAKGEVFRGTCASTSDGGKACTYQYKKTSCLPADGKCGTGYCNLNTQTGETSCVQASQLPKNEQQPIQQDNFWLWVIIFLLVIVTMVAIGWAI